MAYQNARRRQKKVCFYCQDSVNPDFKDLDTLRRYVTERGKIVPRRLTGVCALHQRGLATAVKQARHVALLAFVSENIK